MSLTLETACKLYQEKYPNRKITRIFDTGDEWVFSSILRESDEEEFISPTAIQKEDGKFFTFFPPDHVEKWINRKEVSSEIK